MIKRLLATAAVGLAVWGSARAEDLSGADYTSARKIYTSKCARCHKFYEPTEYTDQEWELWMGKMRKKARLNARDYDLVVRLTEQMRHKGKAMNSLAKPIDEPAK